MRQKRQYNINIIQQKYYTLETKETKRRFVTRYTHSVNYKSVAQCSDTPDSGNIRCVLIY